MKAGTPDRLSKYPKKVTVRNASYLPHEDHPKNEEKDLEHRYGTKRLRSGEGVSEAGEEGPTRRSTRSLSGVRSRNCSSHSEVSDGNRDSAVPTTHVAAVEKGLRKKYERRPRHKTRPDKYELKVDKRRLEKSSHERVHQTSKRKRRKKSGLTLNHDFEASNVLQDRLTLKPNTGPGIFHRGKASVPVERRGLPDLTFPEMNFLTKRRDVDDARHQKSKDVQPPKKMSDKGSAQEISSFFSRPGQLDVALQDPTAHTSGQCKILPKQSISPNKSSPARPGPRKPVSMISGNETCVRAFSTNSLGVAARPKGRVGGQYLSAVQRYYPTQEESSIQRNRPKSTTSYYSWSATPAQKSSLPADLRGPSEVGRFVAEEPNYVQRPHSPPRRDVSEIAKQPPDQSSLSDKSLARYTKHVLLGEDEQGIWDCVPRTAGRGGHYTLQDLKRLARLSELDDLNGSSAIQPDQHDDGGVLGRRRVHLTNFDEHKHAFPIQTSSVEGVNTLAVRSMAFIPKKIVHQQKGAELLSEASVDPAAPGSAVAQSGRQGLHAAEPANRQCLRDSLQLGDLRLTPDRVAWLLSANRPAADVRRRNPVTGYAELAGNPLPFPLMGSPNSVHRVSRHHESAGPNVSVGYSEPSMITQGHFPKPIGHSEPGTKPKPSQVEYDYQRHSHLAGYEMLDDIHNKIHNNAFWDGQDEFDRALLHEPFPQNLLDTSATALDASELARAYDTLVDSFTGLSEAEENLDLGDKEPALGRSYPITSNPEAKPTHSEEGVAAHGVAADGFLRNRTWEQSLVFETGYQEDDGHFMGFARPHILY